MFPTDAVKIIKLIIGPIGSHRPRSSFLPHVDTGLTASIFGMLPESPFLSRVSSTLRFDLDLLSGMKPASFQLQFHFWK
jgi:hypothetical protein